MANTFPTSLNNYVGTEVLLAAGHAQAHNAVEAKIGIGSSTPTASKVLRATGTGTSAWAQVDVTTDLTGTLPVANGGTGRATLTSATILAGNGTSAVSLFTTTGSGTVVALATSPSLTTPTLGVATATSINKVAITTPAASATLTIANTKTLTVNASLTLTGTDSTTMTFPSTTATIARTDAAQTFTGTQTFAQSIHTNNAIAASSNAATVPITSKLHTVTNSSAATLTITLTTTSAVDGQVAIIRVLDFSAVAQTITWVNTENSQSTAPTTSNGSTTLPITVGFMYNSATSKWRCIAVS